MSMPLRTWLPAVAIMAVLATGLVAFPQPPGSATAELPTEPCPTDAVTPGVTPRAEYLSDRLRLEGYSAAAVAGVLGNLDLLSGLTPTAQTTAGDRKGIALWGPERWARLVSGSAAAGTHRWSLSSQATFLIREMKSDPGSFRHQAYRRSTDPTRAAVVYAKVFLRHQGPESEERATRGAKAAQWAALLQGRVVDRTPSDNATYGLVITCEPPLGTLERCPDVPRSFVRFFADQTGFRWHRMSVESKLVSKCIYANFPRIRIHGTYRPGHMPSWGRAIDFMMPRGCTTTNRGSWTNSAADRLLGDRLSQYLLRRSDRFSLDYVIWQDRLRNPDSYHMEDDFAPIEEWRIDPYNNGNCTNTHFDHVHMSVLGPNGQAASWPAAEPSLRQGR